MATTMNQKEYLKKYLGIGKAPGEKKKKKKKEKPVGNRLKIIDDDVDVLISQEIEDDLAAANEDAPQIVAVIDERPISLQVDEKTNSSLWAPIGEPSTTTSESHILKLNSFKLNKQVKSSDSQKSTFKIKKESTTEVYSRYTSSSSSVPKIKQETDDWGRNGREKSKSPAMRNETGSNISSPGQSRGNTPLRRQDVDDASPSRRKYKDDRSPPRKRQRSSDYSPPRRTQINDDSPLTRNDQDYSPPRRNKRMEVDSSPPSRRRSRDADSSPKQRNKTDSSPPRRRRNRDADSSPKQKNKDDSSPPRRRRDVDSPPRRKNKDSSPPRKRHSENNVSPKRKNKDDRKRTNSEERDMSPSRKRRRDGRKSRWSPEKSPELTNAEKIKKTLDGKRAGLQNAADLFIESRHLREKEDEMFANMSADISGRNAATVVRGKKVKDLEEEAAKARREKEMKEKYDLWGKGLKQVEDQNVRMEEQLREMSKPLARYADDEDLEKFLKEQERDGDPMLAYIRKKKKKEQVAAGIPEKPMYMGEFMPNRFGIRPGYRWDGVDRSNGYEKKWFQVQNEKRATREEAFKWSTEDM